MQMEKQEITEYRERLDRTLASPNLTIKEKLQSLVKTQLLRSSETQIVCTEKVVETRTAEVYNFLDMLRSTSINHGSGPKIHGGFHADWKLKQDNEEFRVMYREGPEGTPFHTLLVEGYVDGPLDVCLCISWETALYMKWWPQSIVPTFRILSSECLQKTRSGEQISLVRVKVSWPLSLREAVVHYFLFEYLQDDLIVVLMNTVSDIKSIDEAVHGFSREAIPEAKDVVRIELVGGFALQKVTSERSYFRTIANMDIKLDFVPPALINFISRQLIGSGFRLYQKAVASKLNSSEEFRKALGEPLYTRIRGALVTGPKKVEELNNQQNTGILLNETPSPSNEDEVTEVHSATIPNDKRDVDSNKPIHKHNSRIFGEIEEEADEETEDLILEGVDVVGNLRKEVLKGSQLLEGNRNVSISKEVEEALGTLDKIISMVREYGFNSQTRSSSDSMTDRSLGESKVNSFAFNSLEVNKLRPKDESGTKKPHCERKEATSRAQTRVTSDMNHLRHSAFNSSMKEANMNRIVPEESPSSPNQESQLALQLRNETATEAGILDQKANSDTDFGNGISCIMSPNGSKNSGRHGKNNRYCCFLPKRVK